MQHFWNKPLPNAPSPLEKAIGIPPDLEWYDNSENSKIPQKITELGVCALPMMALRDCKDPDGFLTLLKQVKAIYIRLLENFHMRNMNFAFKDAEKYSLFRETRFVPEAEARRILVEMLDGQMTEDGYRAPVIFFGQG